MLDKSAFKDLWWSVSFEDMGRCHLFPDHGFLIGRLILEHFRGLIQQKWCGTIFLLLEQISVVWLEQLRSALVVPAENLWLLLHLRVEATLWFCVRVKFEERGVVTFHILFNIYIILISI